MLTMVKLEKKLKEKIIIKLKKKKQAMNKIFRRFRGLTLYEKIIYSLKEEWYTSSVYM